jgi:hypothetical protein
MTLNLNPEPASSKKDKNYKKALRVGSVVSLVGLGSTFAANISLNAGDNVEFGQGVAQTAACDEDGFSITPVASYDNTRSIFRLDRVQVSGLNLTPVGTGWNDSDITGTYADQAAAKTAHPGQYYDTDANAWKRTCDGVVLDFKAYTDDPAYASYTRDGYYDYQTSSTSSPVMWTQYQGEAPTSNEDGDLGNSGFAVIFDIYDDNSDFESNYGVDGAAWSRTAEMTFNNLDSSVPASSSFNFYSFDYSRPDAASISKIAVASMATFPSSYDFYDSGNTLGRDL